MKKLIKKFWHDLINDEQFARRLTRALLLGFAASGAGLGAMVTGRAQIAVFVGSGIAGILGGLISVSGTPQQTLAKVEKAQADRDATP
jgi:hypothetical protein